MADSRSTGENTASVRPPRAADIQQERRRRQPGTLDRNANLKLAVPAHIREANPHQHFRWVSDIGNRLYDLTVSDRDDYSKVEGVAPIPVGTSEDGKPVYSHLCMKPMEYHLADQAEKAAAIRETEQGLLRGASPSAGAAGSNELYAKAGNSIRRD